MNRAVSFVITAYAFARLFDDDLGITAHHQVDPAVAGQNGAIALFVAINGASRIKFPLIR